MGDKDLLTERIRELTGELEKKRAGAESIEQLAGKPIDRDFPVDIWELSGGELETELWNRLNRTEAQIKNLPDAAEHSRRMLVGPLIDAVKRMLLRLTRPILLQLLEQNLILFLLYKEQKKEIAELQQRLEEGDSPKP